MKIATWNVNSLRVRLSQVKDWLQTNQPDVLCLQETKLEDQHFPVEEFAAMGYRSLYAGQKTYNGVATITRHAHTDPQTRLPDFEDVQKRLLAANICGVRIINVYIPNGAEVGSDKYAYKLDWLARLTAYVAGEIKRFPRLVLLGDYNIAPEDRDVHDPLAWAGSVLVSDRERAAFWRLIDTGLVDVFRRFEQPLESYSWWDYRAAAFRRNRGLRIDHILCSPALAGLCRACHIDTIPRTLERPSDHAPVVAEFEAG